MRIRDIELLGTIMKELKEVRVSEDFKKGFSYCKGIVEKFVKTPTEEEFLCEYCHEDSEGYVKALEKNGHAFIFNMTTNPRVRMKAKGWSTDVPINYCPMCGRFLRDVEIYKRKEKE